jgi:rhodanese-related sulfurtransferase/DNA-directed RNA polymerase subunit RPC12/RpoP
MEIHERKTRKMIRQTISAIVIFLFIASIPSCNTAHSKEKKETGTPVVYVCTPCGSNCDTLTLSNPGNCTHCNMQLVDRKTIVHKNIQPEQMCSLDEKKVLFLDVRTAAEFNGTAEEKFGAIKNAVNIPVQELEARMNELEKYRDKHIVVYCSHSHRSPRASYMLTQNGYKQVTNMLGGMSIWKESVKNNACNNKLYIKQ